MTDRNVQYPTRYRMTKVAGTDDIYEMEPVPGDVTDEGTIINKAALLKDATAAMYGFTAEQIPDVVPDDIFAFLGRYNQYWWKTRTQEQSIAWEMVLTGFSGNFYILDTLSAIATITLSYADSVEIDPMTGELSLVEPFSISATYNSIDTWSETIKGKYVKGFTISENLIAYIPESAVYARSTNNSAYQVYITGASKVSSRPYVKNVFGDWYTVTSSDRESYPDHENDITAEFTSTEYFDIEFVDSMRNPNNTVTIQYSDSIAVEGDRVVLVDPVTINLVYSSGDFTVLNGKYFISADPTFGRPGSVFFRPQDAEDFVKSSKKPGGYLFYFLVGKAKLILPPVGSGHEYMFLGRPLDEISSGTLAHIEIGSYIGTGTYGIDNQNVLSFDGVPVLFAVYLDAEALTPGNTYWLRGFLWSFGNKNVYAYSGGWDAVRFTNTEKTLSWYAATNTSQQNKSGMTYNYIAILK